MITAISSLIAMNSFCSGVSFVCVCMCVLSPGSFRSNRVCNRLSHHKPCSGADAHTHKQYMHTHTHTHTPGSLLYSWVCHVVFGSEALCRCRAAIAKSLHTMCDSRHTHTHTCAKIKSTHSHLATFYGAAHHPSNEWDARGTRVLEGKNWPTN